jgi:hypothetical protein
MSSVTFPLQLLLAFVTYGLLARWFVAPRLADLPRETALQALLVVQAFRFIGLVFLAPAAVSPSLPQTFAVPAGLGTALAGVLALIAIAALRARSPLAMPLTWLQTVEGLVDFANAFLQARGGVIEQLGAAYYVPIVIVPAAIVSHVMILRLLLRRSS